MKLSQLLFLRVCCAGEDVTAASVVNTCSPGDTKELWMESVKGSVPPSAADCDGSLL